MKTLPLIAAALGLFVSISALAAAPADAPAGTTGACKDGSYSNAAEKKGACRGHKGVKDWYAEAPAAKAAAPTTPAAGTKPQAAPAATTTPAAPTAAAATTPAKTATKAGGAFTPAAAAAPGGGPGMVWGNDSSKVYHCQSDKWYGKTKHGEYMTEADAKAKGFHAEHGKACSG